MPGTMVEFRANGHTASGYLAVPPAGKGPALIVLQEYWGLVPHIMALADRFANAGFVALALDLYHGESTKSPDEAGKLFMALDIVRAGKDMHGAAEFLLAHSAVTSKKAGILGFCMGGQLALFAAMEYPALIAACVDFYGIHPKVRIDAARVKVPVLGHFATRDKSNPEAQVRALAGAVAAAGGSFTLHFYEADHAFFNDSRPTVYSETNAKLAWDRTLAFLKDNVK
jgi:carboxymethylenebutenolidase